MTVQALLDAGVAPVTSEPPPAAAAPRRYSAFISYTHADRKIAERLRARLERYRLPHHLARRVGFTRIKPVAIDREDMAAASDLSAAILGFIAQSDYLIVVCTPHTPGSVWVGREIDAFRAMHGDEHILCAMFDGDETQCFHPRLLVRSDGTATQPLAPDFRKEADGQRFGLLKLIAVLAGVSVDELAQRDAHRQMRRFAIFGGVSIAIAIAIAGTSYIAYSERRAAVEERMRSARAMEFQLNELREKIKAGGTLDMAAALNRGVELYYDDQQGEEQPLEIELRRVQLLQAKAEDDEKRGNLAAATAAVTEASKISARLRARHPDDPKVLYLHAQSAFREGSIAWLRGDTPLAANALGRYADLAALLVRLDPNNIEWRYEAGYANSNLGSLALREARDFVRAERYFNIAQASFRAVAGLEKDKSRALYELADGEAWLADVDRLKGDLASGMRHRGQQEALLIDLLRRDPRNVPYRVDRVANRLGTARLSSAQGDYRQARDQLAVAYQEVTELQAEDPANEAVASQKRAIQLFTVENEFDATGRQAGTLARAGAQLGDCARDRHLLNGPELSVFCSLLSARRAVLEGNRGAAQRILAEAWLGPFLTAPAFSQSWRLDFAAKCRALGVPAVCSAGAGARS